MEIGTYVLGTAAVLCVGAMLWFRGMIACVWAFMGLSAAVAGCFLLLGAAFVGVVQLMAYVGGVLVLLAYGMMLSGKQEWQRPTRVSFAAVCLGIGLSGVLLYAWSQATFLPPPAVSDVDTFARLGLLMVSAHGLLVEGIGVLLLVVLVGVVRLLHVADEEQPQQPQHTQQPQQLQQP